jgi:quinol monooxygenase YgiN
MPKIGQLYTSGQWLVKPGKEPEFISAWDTFVQWTVLNQAGAGSGHLIQDTANSRSFLSFAPWDSQDAIQQWRQKPEFQSFVNRARELCDDIKPSTFTLVALGIPRG